MSHLPDLVVPLDSLYELRASAEKELKMVNDAPKHGLSVFMLTYFALALDCNLPVCMALAAGTRIRGICHTARLIEDTHSAYSSNFEIQIKISTPETPCRCTLIIYFYREDLRSYHIKSTKLVLLDITDSNSPVYYEEINREDRHVDAALWPQLVTFAYCRLPDQKQIDQFMHCAEFQNKINLKREEVQSRLNRAALDNQKAAEQFAKEYNKFHAMDSESFSEWKNDLEEDLDFYCEDEESFGE